MWVEGIFPRTLRDETQTRRRKKKAQARQERQGGSANMADTQVDGDDPEYAFTVGDKKQAKIEIIIYALKI